MILDQQQILIDDGYYILTKYWICQTFTAGFTDKLEAVTIYLDKIGSPASLVVEIRTTSGGLPTGTILATETILAANINDGAETLISFSSQPSLTSEAQYAIVLHTAGDNSNKYRWKDYEASDNYIGGEIVASYDSGSAWYPYSGQDFYFKTWMSGLVLFDIDNDFRTLKLWAKDDMVSDFRMVGTPEVITIANDFRMSVELIDTNNDFRMVGILERIDMDVDFRSVIETKSNLSNKIRTTKLVIGDIVQKFNSCIEVVKNITNVVSFNKQSISDVSNDIRTKKETKPEVNNDFRMLSPWQVPEAGEVGFQSAGKTEVKVYINSAEQTDVDVDSITITQILNGAASASFILGRAYDSSKPNINSSVEIKYKDWSVYKGYITNINPTDNPESMRIECQDEYWNLNKTKKYFLVGRKPEDTNEYYYETVNQALSGLGFSYGVGNFIPQTIDLYGTGISDAISSLVQNSGNYSWFIKPDGTKCLWQAGEGNIINLQKQELGKNLSLYQTIRHSFTESILGLINKFRVQMGNKTIREATRGRGTNNNIWTWKHRITTWAIPGWDTTLEAKAKTSDDGYGWDSKDPSKDYKDVFRKFWLPDLNPRSEAWSDVRPPVVEIFEGIPYFNSAKEYKKEGFTIDYESLEQEYGEFQIVGYGFRPAIIFSEPQVEYELDETREPISWRTKSIKLHLIKEEKVTPRDTEQTNPDEEPDATELMFYTDKWGDYPETIIADLNLSGLSIQEGFILYDEVEVPVKKWIYDFWLGNRLITVMVKRNVIVETIPSWDDTEFAKDIANWKLSQICDKKITGSVDLIIDGIFYYNIDLTKRIKINGVVDPINIKSITYNFNTFIATLQLENDRYYRRTVSYPNHGE